MTDLHWDTSITKLTPTEIRVRGYSIGDLMRKLTFAQAVWLVLMGEIPDEKLSTLLDAILVATVDHSAAPPSTIAARNVAATGASLNTAVASGIMCMNKFHGGATEGCFKALNEAVTIARSDNLTFDAAADAVISIYKQQKKPVPGFGHLLHTSDPRTTGLFAIAGELGLAGDHIKMANVFAAHFKKAGKNLPININGAVGAVLGDIGVPPNMMNGFFMISRVPGLIAHVLEEQKLGVPLRKIHPIDYGYSGPEDREIE